MYEVFWYNANLGSTNSLEEACVDLYRNFLSTGYSLNEEDVNAWTSSGSGIKKDDRWMSTLQMLYCGKRLADLWNSYEFHNSHPSLVFANGAVVAAVTVAFAPWPSAV